MSQETADFVREEQINNAMESGVYLPQDQRMLRRYLNECRDQLKKTKEEELALSGAYLRLRSLIPGAFNTPHAPTPTQVWETTETALKALNDELAKEKSFAEQMRASFEAALAINARTEKERDKLRDAQNYLLKPETAEFVAKFLCNYHVGQVNSIWESGLTDRENRIAQAADLLRGLINFINEPKQEDKSELK